MGSEAPAHSNQEILLAKWSDRFFAWLIDFVIVQVVLGAVLAAVAFPFWFTAGFDRMDGGWSPKPFDGPVSYVITSAAFFAYWTFFESTRGQSIGKMILKIKTVNLAGMPSDPRSVAIQSFGKSFLLPLDLILGWIFTNDKRQRIFNRASDTVVVKIKDGYGEQGTAYKKD
jgi:uncharacterized RDD family membrane protein YckC